jgi:hypothetical protein
VHGVAHPEPGNARHQVERKPKLCLTEVVQSAESRRRQSLFSDDSAVRAATPQKVRELLDQFDACFGGHRAIPAVPQEFEARAPIRMVTPSGVDEHRSVDQESGHR